MDNLYRVYYKNQYNNDILDIYSSLSNTTKHEVANWLNILDNLPNTARVFYTEQGLELLRESTFPIITKSANITTESPKIYIGDIKIKEYNPNLFKNYIKIYEDANQVIYDINRIDILIENGFLVDMEDAGENVSPDKYSKRIYSDINNNQDVTATDRAEVKHHDRLPTYDSSTEQYLKEYMEIMHESSLNFTSPEKRKAKKITKKEDIEYILSIDHAKAQERDVMMELFADFGDGPRFNPYDIITIPPHVYGGLSKSKDAKLKEEAGTSSKLTNSSSFDTTVGLYVFNKNFIEPFCDILGYINKSITKKEYEGINQKLSYALLQDKITTRQLKNFIINTQIVMAITSAICPSHTQTIFSMQEKMAAKKKEILSRPGFQEKIDNGDLVAMKEMEDETIKYAQEILRDDPAIDMYNSSARSSWGNNFKSMYIMRSGLKGTDGKYNIVTSSYIEGMDPKDYAVVADASVGGPFSRSRRTASGGHLERLILGATAHLKVLGKDSDCGSDKYITVSLNEKNVSNWYYSFIISGNGKLVELLPDNAKQYIGKTVKMRYVTLCKAKNGYVCEHCVGTLFRRIGIENIGMSASICGSSIKLKAMKAFHDNSLNLAKADAKIIFGN